MAKNPGIKSASITETRLINNLQKKVAVKENVDQGDLEIPDRN